MVQIIISDLTLCLHTSISWQLLHRYCLTWPSSYSSRLVRTSIIIPLYRQRKWDSESLSLVLGYPLGSAKPRSSKGHHARSQLLVHWAQQDEGRAHCGNSRHMSCSTPTCKWARARLPWGRLWLLSNFTSLAQILLITSYLFAAWLRTAKGRKEKMEIKPDVYVNSALWDRKSGEREWFS
jgi:hypothetical protein